MNKVTNMAARLARTFPWTSQTKHDHYKDFGYPEQLTFDQLFRMYIRNGLARAAISKTVTKTWETMPSLWETEEPAETTLEQDLRRYFAAKRFWQRLLEADRMSLVGGYSGVILRFADDKRFLEPVDRVPGGVEGLVEVIPAWASQLTVSSWDTDERSPGYGHPAMFQFNESDIDSGGAYATSRPRSFQVHPSRVLVWSSDGTVHARSFLEPGYNDLVDMEKVKGASGEGFWKNAKSAPVLSIPPEARLKDMAELMGVSPAEIFNAMNEQVSDWQRGFDQLLMLQGMKAETLGINLPSPEHFFGIALQSFAASVDIPLKILVGNQTGERASTEDAESWASTNMGRRSNTVMPILETLVQRLEDVGVLPERDWHIHWQDLTESSMAEKIERADKMATVNQKQGDEPVFTVDEIRGAIDFEPVGSLGGLPSEEEENNE